MKHLLLYLFLLPLLAFADATPKFYHKINVEFFTEKGKQITQWDSVVLFVNPYEDSFFVDTLCLNREAGGYSDFDLNYYKDELFLLEKRKLEFFKLGLWSNGKQYSSPWIVNSGQRTLYQFIVRVDGKLYDDSPPFYARVSEYWIAFLMTLLLESLYWIWLNRNIKLPWTQLLKMLLVVNVISHPLLWWMHSHTEINIILLEAGVILLESVILFVAFASHFPYTKFFKWSLIANVISWWLGGIIIFIMSL